MPMYMGIHTLPPGGFTREQLNQLAQAAQQDPAVRGYRSFVNLSEGKAVCIFEAPDKEALAAWFQKRWPDQKEKNNGYNGTECKEL